MLSQLGKLIYKNRQYIEYFDHIENIIKAIFDIISPLFCKNPYHRYIKNYCSSLRIQDRNVRLAK